MDKKKGTPSSAPSVSDDDRKLFRESIGEVKEIYINQAEITQRKPKPVPKQQQQDAAEVLNQLAEAPFDIEEVETGDELSFARQGVQKQTLKKLRRGQYIIERELDLHGLTVAEAKPVLNQFLTTVIHSGKRCVRIIHGKGHGSKNKLPVLKNKLNIWLRQDKRILAFCSARQNDGGTGAVYVLIKKWQT